MNRIVTCKDCGRQGHYAYQCWKNRKPIAVKKRPPQRGKEYYKYAEFKKTVAIPYLNEKYGRKCQVCGTHNNLEIDHIKGRGSHPELKYDLDNLQYLCTKHHRQKTDMVVFS